MHCLRTGLGDLTESILCRLHCLRTGLGNLADSCLRCLFQLGAGLSDLILSSLCCIFQLSNRFFGPFCRPFCLSASFQNIVHPAGKALRRFAAFFPQGVLNASPINRAFGNNPVPNAVNQLTFSHAAKHQFRRGEQPFYPAAIQSHPTGVRGIFRSLQRIQQRSTARAVVIYPLGDIPYYGSGIFLPLSAECDCLSLFQSDKNPFHSLKPPFGNACKNFLTSIPLSSAGCHALIRSLGEDRLTIFAWQKIVLQHPARMYISIQQQAGYPVPEFPAAVPITHGLPVCLKDG